MKSVVRSGPTYDQQVENHFCMPIVLATLQEFFMKNTSNVSVELTLFAFSSTPHFSLFLLGVKAGNTLCTRAYLSALSSSG